VDLHLGHFAEVPLKTDRRLLRKLMRIDPFIRVRRKQVGHAAQENPSSVSSSPYRL